MGGYLNLDTDWKTLIGKNLTDDEGHTLPTNQDSYHTETEEGVRNAIKLYQCMLNRGGGAVDVDGEPSPDFMYQVMNRVGTKAKKDFNYSVLLNRARQVHTELISQE